MGPPIRVDPSGRDRDELLVESLGPLSVERQPPKQDHPRDRVGDLREAGAREIVVDEPLRTEPCQQPLGHSLLEVQVHGRVAEDTRVVEHDRPERRFTPPVGELLPSPSRCAQRVERRRPARITLLASPERREPPRVLAVLLASARERLGAEQLQQARQRVAEWFRLDSRPPARAFQQRSAALDLLA